MLIITELENEHIELLHPSMIHGFGVFSKRRFEAGEWFLISNPDCGFNHSCNPNVKIVPDVGFQTLRVIEANEEMTVDYGSDWDWKGWAGQNTCNCPVCRKEREDQ